VLLVGETGTGKTTVCQLLALLRAQHLHILNCNQHTETSDFLGGFRPARGREAAAAAFLAACRRVAGSGLYAAVGAEAPGVEVGAVARRRCGGRCGWPGCPGGAGCPGRPGP
jgi:midasin